ncbi:unnamed protein product, partial [Cylicocyclus nassatus]
MSAERKSSDGPTDSMEGFLPEQRTMESDQEDTAVESAKPAETLLATARSTSKKSTRTPVTVGADIMDLVQRYEEQPTMSVTVLRRKKKPSQEKRRIRGRKPTPPPASPKETMKVTARTAVGPARKEEAVDMHTAEGLQRKRRRVKSKELHEMVTQREGKALEEVEFAADDKFLDDEDLQTALPTSKTLERLKRIEMKLIRSRPKVANTSRTRTLVDILSIMCLIPVMNDYWIVPVQAIQYGGLAYMLLYATILVLLVQPVLSMVLFASQYAQVGIVNIFKLYGPIPEGLGYGYAFLIFVMQLKIIQQGSILIKHLRFTYLDNLSIGTCNEYFVGNGSKCSSIFMDAQCVALNRTHKYYAQGYCWNVQPLADSETSSINLNFSFLLQPESGTGF